MELDLIHEQLISEENVNVNDLPDSIKRKIKGFNLMYEKANNNPEDEKIKHTITRTSIGIADDIQNWLETDFEEEEEEDNSQGDNDKKDSKKTTSAPKNNNVNNISTAPTSNTTDNAPKRFGNLVMEKKILSFMTSNGNRIDTKTLTSIILKEPSYPTQIVHSIVLKKVFLSSSYTLA